MKTQLFALTSLCIAASAFAAHDQSPQSLSFDDIRVACQNPAKFQNQTAPTNIQVSCHDVQNKWIPDADGTYSMGTSRMITSSVYSDKYSVSPLSASVTSAPQVVACARYKEVAETVDTVRSVSCDELIAFNGTALDFCSAAVNSLRSSNKEAITTEATGRTASLCDTAIANETSNGQSNGQH